MASRVNIENDSCLVHHCKKSQFTNSPTGFSIFNFCPHQTCYLACKLSGTSKNVMNWAVLGRLFIVPHHQNLDIEKHFHASQLGQNKQAFTTIFSRRLYPHQSSLRFFTTDTSPGKVGTNISPSWATARPGNQPTSAFPYSRLRSQESWMDLVVVLFPITGIM